MRGGIVAKGDGTNLSEELSNRRVVAVLREVGHVERRLPGNADFDLDFVDLLLVLSESGRDDVLSEKRKKERSSEPRRFLERVRGERNELTLVMNSTLATT